MILAEIKSVLSKLESFKNDDIFLQEEFKKFSKLLRSFIDETYVENNIIYHRAKGEVCYPLYVSSLDKWSMIMLNTYTLTLNLFLINFKSQDSQLTKEAILLCVKLVGYKILTDDNIISQTFHIISKLLNESDFNHRSVCFELVERICFDNRKAHNCLLNSNLNGVLIRKFKNYFEVQNVTTQDMEETHLALKTIYSISQESDSFLMELVDTKIHSLLIKYISLHFNDGQDILFDGCINLLKLMIMENQSRKRVKNNKELFVTTLDILNKCQVDKNWASFFKIYEEVIMKFPDVGLDCAKRNIFGEFLEYILPSIHLKVVNTKTKQLANIMILMTISVDACRYLLNANFDLKILQYIYPDHTELNASFCHILGNFCINDDVATDLVMKYKLGDIIIQTLFTMSGKEESYKDITSYLSTLKSLAIPSSNRLALFSIPNFMETIEKLSNIQCSQVLLYLFTFLRVMAYRTDITIAKSFVTSSSLLNAVIKCSKEEYHDHFLQSTALLLLLTLIVMAKSDFINFEFIDKDFIKGISKNINHSFLSDFFGHPNANEILFSILSDDHIRMLNEYRYFDEMYSLIIDLPHHPLLIYNAIPSFRRFLNLGLHISDSEFQLINNQFLSEMATLANYPDIISTNKLNQIIKEFKNINR